MILNMEQAVRTLRAKLDDVEQVEHGVFRGVRRYREKPYAVFYVDLTDTIEDRASTLEQFQDRVLGRHYFDSPGDLRWNSYLLLLTESSRIQDKGIQSARAALEADRNYARKYVITLDELAPRVDAQVPQPVTAYTEPVDILDRWERLLSPVGLDGVFGDGDIAPLVRALGSEPLPRPNSRLPHIKTPSEKREFSHPLVQLRLERFRRFPRITQFDFGSVNLIHGVNGVGKTTLLEAIEYLYCGANRRSVAPENARIVGLLKDSKAAITTSAQTGGQIFRDRQLVWYGKLSMRGNQLPEGFSVYNFLNTDAAVHLATDDSPAAREKDLATLLVGAEAARVWGRIERVIERVPPEIRSLERQLEALLAKRNTEQSRLKMAETTPRQSDEIFAQLKANLLQLGWTQALPSKQGALPRHIDLSKCESTLRSALGLQDLPPEVTPGNLEAAISSNQSWLERADAILQEYSDFSDRKKAVENKQKSIIESQDTIRRLLQYSTSGYADAVVSLDHQNGVIARAVREIGGLDPERFAAVELVIEPLPLAALYGQASTREVETAQAASTARQLFNAFKAEHSKLQALAQELRAIAHRFIESAADSDNCPLCHTRFAPGELASQMLSAVDPSQAAREGELSEAVAAAQKHHETWREVARQLNELQQYCRRMGISDDLTPDDVLAHLRQSVRSLEMFESERDSTSTRLRALEETGFLLSEYNVLREKLSEALSGRADAEHLEELLRASERSLTDVRAQLAPFQEQLNQLRSKRDALVADGGFEQETTIRLLQEGLQRRLANLRSVLELTPSLKSLFGIEATTQLASVLSTLSAASAAQERLRLSLQAEAAADKSIAEARLGFEAAERQHKSACESLGHFRAAEMALNELQSLHSLELATREALKLNRIEVARIFERIHAPHEFEISTSDEAPLQRIESKEPIQLGRISSGQRAAFALSLFLALNSRASRAPPVMLIDDPVAHVDDLNTLSFLDHLRDLAATGRRQIFFATADEKLAALFAHKFSFLGAEFQNYSLSRS